MKLNSIHIKNFKSIGEAYINFDDFIGLSEISGKVGSGKTSLAEAIVFGLFGSIKDKNNNDLISWNENKCNLKVSLTSNGHDIFIDRTISKKGASPLEVTVDGKKLITTNKRDAQSILENEYYDVSKFTLESLCIISFNSFKSLSRMSPYDTRRFLDSTFMLSLLNSYNDKCIENRKREEESKSDLSKSKIAAEASMKNIEKMRQINEAGTCIETLQELKQQHSDVTKELAAKNADREADMKAINESINANNNSLSIIKSNGVRIKKEIDFIERGFCPTCGAAIDKKNLEEKKSERNALLENYNSIVNSNKLLEHKLNECRLVYSEPIRELESKKNELYSKIIKKEEYERAKIFQDSEYDDMKSSLEDIESSINNIEKEISEWSQLSDLCSNDLRSYIMASIMPAINESINDFLVELEQPYSVMLDNNFKCTIKILGIDQDVPVSSLSTGQNKMIDMVIILGVLNVLMNGLSFNVFFLDELFSNMDDDLRSKMCMILKKNINKDSSIFIICHASLNNDYIDNTLVATMSGYSSSFKKI